MPTITLQLPQMYGDHHVVAVRNLLGAIPGVLDVYASSAFQVVEISFDEDQVGDEALRASLQEAGYMREVPIIEEKGAEQNGAGRSQVMFRHSASLAQAGNVVTFRQAVPYQGQPLWPCPGLSHNAPAEKED